MNQRIMELAKEAATSEGWGPEVWQTTFSEKFAELIVQECANLTKWQEFEMCHEQRIRLAIYQDIKEHFGFK